VQSRTACAVKISGRSGGIRGKSVAVSLLPNRFPCNAATFAASVWVIAAFAVDATVHGARGAGASRSRIHRLHRRHTDRARRLGGRYCRKTNTRWQPAAATTGILKFFSSARGHQCGAGSFSGGQPVATSYVASIDYNRRPMDVSHGAIGRQT